MSGSRADCSEEQDQSQEHENVNEVPGVQRVRGGCHRIHPSASMRERGDSPPSCQAEATWEKFKQHMAALCVEVL